MSCTQHVIAKLFARILVCGVLEVIQDDLESFGEFLLITY
jgi:hypothetical protein